MLPPSGMKEDKSSLHGKGEQSMALDMARRVPVLVRLALAACTSSSRPGDPTLKARDGRWYELNIPSIFRLHGERCSSPVL